MHRFAFVGLALTTCLVLVACQTPEARRAELVQICSNPFNRDPQSFYAGECQAIAPETPQELQRDYVLGAPAAR